MTNDNTTVETVDGFIYLPVDLVHSGKWRSAPTKALCILIHLWSYYDGKNNGAIRYSVRQAMEHVGCSPNTAVRSLKFLQDAGWIEATKRGGFELKSEARAGRASTWRIKLELVGPE